MARLLVAGGSAGIGSALVDQLVAAGHTVYNLDKSPRPPSASIGAGRCVTRMVDLRDDDAVDRVTREIAAEAEGLTGVAAVCGVGHGTPLEELSPREFRAQCDGNLAIVFTLCRMALPFLGAGASVVTVSSTTIYGNGERASVAYASAKAGIVGLTRSLAAEVASKGIRVNCVVPGAVDTPHLRSLSTPTERRMLRTLVPMGRFAAAAEVADVIQFLLGDGARYITGQTIVVDGGLSLAYRPLL